MVRKLVVAVSLALMVAAPAAPAGAEEPCYPEPLEPIINLITENGITDRWQDCGQQ